MPQPTDRNTVLGAGYVFFDRLVSGSYQGELYIANTPDLALSVEAGGNVVDYDADGPIAVELLNVDTQITRSLSFSAKHITGNLMSLFLPGTLTSYSSTSGALTAQPINGGGGVKQGYWYQLGANLYPGGARLVSSVAIEDADPTTYDITDDYLLDLVLGRVYIVPGGGIANNTVITADFSEATASWEAVASTTLLEKVEGRFRFVANNTSGTNRDLFVPASILTPNGSLSLKSRTDVQSVGFNVRIQTPTETLTSGALLPPMVFTARAVAA
jgi:hypothetical protein